MGQVGGEEAANLHRRRRRVLVVMMIGGRLLSQTAHAATTHTADRYAKQLEHH